MKKLFVFFIIFSMFLSLGSFVVSADETNTSDFSARDKWIEDYQEFYNNSFDMPCAYYKLNSYVDGSYYYYSIGDFKYATSADKSTASSEIYEYNSNNEYIKKYGGDSLHVEYRKLKDTNSGGSYSPSTFFVFPNYQFVYPCNGTASLFFDINGAINADIQESDSSTYNGYFFIEEKEDSYNFSLNSTFSGVYGQTSQFSSHTGFTEKTAKHKLTGEIYPHTDFIYYISSSMSFKYTGYMVMSIRGGVMFTPDVPLEINDQIGIDEAPVYYIDDSGEYHQLNIVFVDHSNKLVYSPVTNEYIEYKNISYDYDNFTYNFTTVNEENITLSFNEENITYDYGGNVYNYYYTVNNYNDSDEPNGSDDDSDNSGIIEWLEKIYKAVKGIDSDNDIDVTINNITNNEEDTNSFFEGFKLKLKWIEDVYHIAQMLLGGASAQADMAYAYAEAIAENPESASYLSTGAPTIYLNLGNADSHYGYDYGGTAVAYDFSWYAPYKPTVDSIAGGFLWLLYLWGLVKHVPEILNGMGIAENRISGMVSKFLDD